MLVVKGEQGPDKAESLRLRRRVLSLVLGLAPEALQFENGPEGKPRLLGTQQLHFSVSHSGPYWAIAWDRKAPIGLDLETWKDLDRLRRLERRLLKPEEKSHVQAASNELAEIQRLLEIWTLKEAITKLRGTNLFESFQSVNTRSLPPEIESRSFCEEGAYFLSWVRLKGS